MHVPVQPIGILLIAIAASLPLSARPQTKPTDASGEISRIIYSDLSKAEMLDQLAAFVRVGDKLEDFPIKTGLELGLCLSGGPGVEDCQLSNGLQLVADPDGLVQVIRRDSRVVDGKTFHEMSISTHLLHWNGYVRGYPQ